MDLLNKIKHYEYLHIVFWLIKDSCWMMEFKVTGTLMIVPTIGLAIMIVYHTWRTIDVYINMAILFWICANSFWMVLEFFDHTNLKTLAAVPFLLGFVFVGIFYYKRWKGHEPLDRSPEN
jgi:hypothetical protein